MADTANSKTVPPQFWKSGPTLDRQKIAEGDDLKPVVDRQFVLAEEPPDN